MTARAAKKRRASAAKKGRHGGAREGAGRKRDRLPKEVVERLGPITADMTPEQLDQWVRRALAELVVLQMTGGVSTELAASIRATCGEIRRSMPDAPPRDPDDDDDDDEEGDGPELEDEQEDGADDGALRVE